MWWHGSSVLAVLARHEAHQEAFVAGMLFLLEADVQTTDRIAEDPRAVLRVTRRRVIAASLGDSKFKLELI